MQKLIFWLSTKMYAGDAVFCPEQAIEIDKLNNYNLLEE
jgi:hypothetical protein